MSSDLILRGGEVVDGTGSPPFQADLVVRDGRISEIGSISWAEGVTELEVPGLWVCPGIIDIHSHSDFTLMVDPRAMSSVMQGVTLEVVGNCGHGCAPILDPERARSNIYGCQASDDISWRTMAEYLERLEARQPAVNVISLVPNGLLRLAAVQDVSRPSSPEELSRMKYLLAQCLEEGAFGLSTGLEYGPEKACSEEEIGELCRLVGDAGGFYSTHTRNCPGEVEETIAEAIRTVRASGVPLQISHIQVVARLIADGCKAYRQALGLVDKARQQGQDVGFDMHTRLFGTMNLRTALPPWALEGGVKAVASRLENPGLRADLKTYQSPLRSLVQDDWERIVIFESLAHPEFSGKSVGEIGREMGVEPLDAVYDLLLAEVDDIHRLMVLALTYRMEENQVAFEHPLCMVGSDATALATDGPLRERSFHGAYTWASWFYRHFVRDTGKLRPEEAIRRLTSLPGSRLGLRDRGIIKKGACADLAIFDPETFSERGTLYQPNQTAVGMTHVVVNGVLTVKDGELTGDRGGRVLRRQQV